MVKGVITGDIVDSSKMTVEQRAEVLNFLEGINQIVASESTNLVEVFRGDSFQVLVDEPSLSLFVAIYIRSELRAMTPATSDFMWDARISIGVGDVDFQTDKVRTSDGEAFRNSGRGLDAMKKNERLVITTPWEDFNKELEVSTAFADAIISNWTKNQAQISSLFLSEKMTQKEIAELLETSVQNVSAALSAAKMGLINRYINRFELKVKEYGIK